MTPQEFIEKKLNSLKVTEKQVKTFTSQEELADSIFKIIMSKKFRKFSAKAELVEHIKNAIKINIEKKQPINFVFPHGAYKLWRLEETPLPDWAELFSSIYYTKWLKEICEIYEPGVLFEYFVDDLILPRMNNVSLVEVDAYLNEYQKILDFLKEYQPKNFHMKITRFGSLYSSPEVFEKDLDESIEKFLLTNPVFSEEQLKMTELNVKPTKEQLKDLKWREKIRLIHDAYLKLKTNLGYYFRPETIAVFCQKLPSGKFLALGTTKTSVAKFWVGIGVLKNKENEFIEHILSPSQLEKAKLVKENISIPGLDGKNFKTIKILNG